MTWTIDLLHDQGADLWGATGRTDDGSVSFTRDPVYATRDDARQFAIEYIAQWEASNRSTTPVVYASETVTLDEIEQVIAAIAAAERSNGMTMGAG